MITHASILLAKHIWRLCGLLGRSLGQRVNQQAKAVGPAHIPYDSQLQVHLFRFSCLIRVDCNGKVVVSYGLMPSTFQTQCVDA